MLADINGLPMREHIGQRPSEVLAAPMGELVEEKLREVVRTGQVIRDPDFRATSPLTGETRYYESQWFPAPGEDGSVTGVAVLVIDVTQRRDSEDALRRSIERTEKLQHATAALAETLTVRDVCRVAGEIGRSALGALSTEVHLDEAVDLAGGDGIDGAHQVALPMGLPGGRAGLLRMHLPAAPDPEDRTLLAALAGQCAIALARAQLYERERATAVALQQSLLPDRLPDVPGVEMAARIRAGSPEADVGGDWYDVFSLPDGRVVLVVGDVMGKGVQAAAGMGRLRSALRALAHSNPLPEAVLQGLDRVFTATEGTDQIATMVYVLVNPGARRAAIAGAGHLPLVLQRAGEPPVLVDAGGAATPLGWPEPRSQRTLELGPGDLLLGFTDGLVERRGADIDQGLGELLALTNRSHESLDDLVDDLVSNLLASARGRDDATVLAVRFHG